MEAVLGHLHASLRRTSTLRDRSARSHGEKIAPRSADIDEQAEDPWDIRKLLAEQDILGLPVPPPEYGGTGTGTLMLNMAVEEIAKVDAASAR